MSQLSKILSTAAAGALDVWVGIVTGLALGLSPALSGAVSVASGLAGILFPPVGLRVSATAFYPNPDAAQTFGGRNTGGPLPPYFGEP